MKCLRAFVLSWLFVALAYGQFEDQPNNYASSLTTHSGAPVYDWEFANMIKMWIAQPGYNSALFFFAQCYGGGMLDDLREKLFRTNGDFAGMSASKHNQASWGLSDGATWPAKGFDKAEDFWAKELGEAMAETDNPKTAKEMADEARTQDVFAARNRTPPKREDPQFTSLRNGANVKLGQTAGGDPVASRHAILFMGKPDGERHWNDLERARAALMGHGFTDGEMTILAGDGATQWDGSAAPGYVDGAGTKAALFAAIEAIGPQMNANEQFVFWASDHGNRERTEHALNRVVTDPVKQRVPPGNFPRDGLWDCDRKMVKDAAHPLAERFVSVILDEQFTLSKMDEIRIYFNGKPLELAAMSEVVGYDDDPAVDGFDFVFGIPKKIDIRPRNKIEIEWVNPETFEPLLIRSVQIGVSMPTRAVRIRK